MHNQFQDNFRQQLCINPYSS